WDPSKTPAGHVIVRDGTMSWDAKAERPTLEGISLTATPGSLTMVVGGVGSGKSSLMSALIGHIGRLGGEVEVGGKIAYVAQTAWVMNDTLQENVLMGSPLDPVRYRAALEVSQLGPDLDILPNGDLTEIGDRGITLSGGQKQRVSIARAV
ncbi:Canalicular multispecific organic anion transporter 2, partial [Tetrabaena socialis]